jgi:hypothetical protein
MRAEYRGFVYNSRTYDLPVFNGLDRITHRAEPSVGFVTASNIRVMGFIVRPPDRDDSPADFQV